MWAVLPLQSLKPWPPNAVATTKPPQRRYFTAVQNRKAAGGFEQAAEKEDLEDQRQPGELSGADVLMALQRATAHKAKKKKEKRVADVLSKSRNKAAIDNQGPPSLRNVRPLCIKPEWRDRLEELETRLGELAHR